jgi:lysophospholipase L1-like esterase
MWKDIQSYFPDQHILNRGFGGSQMSDLLYFADQVIVSAQPKLIFIYEGDNDLGSGKSNEQILSDSKALVAHIRKALGQVPVVFITPKPSKARWHLKDKYVAYNEALMEWAGEEPDVSVADLWTPMLDEKGVVLQDIFLKDGLHMNKKGYDIWGKTLLPLVK